MRVVYKSIKQEIDEAIAEAKAQNKRISYIELTRSEHSQLHSLVAPHLMYPNIFHDEIYTDHYGGVELRVKR